MKQIIFGLVFLLLPSLSGAATVYKCQGEKGRPVFQQSPCEDEAGAERLEIKQPSPERLKQMQREEFLRELDWDVYKQKQSEKRQTAQRIRDIHEREDRLRQIDEEHILYMQQLRRNQAAHQEWWDCERATSVRVGTPCYRQKTGR